MQLNLDKYNNIFITQRISGSNKINNYGTAMNIYHADLILVQIEDSNKYIVEKDRYGTSMGNIITLTESLIAKLELLDNVIKINDYKIINLKNKKMINGK